MGLAGRESRSTTRSTGGSNVCYEWQIHSHLRKLPTVEKANGYREKHLIANQRQIYPSAILQWISYRSICAVFSVLFFLFLLEDFQKASFYWRNIDFIKNNVTVPIGS